MRHPTPLPDIRHPHATPKTSTRHKRLYAERSCQMGVSDVGAGPLVSDGGFRVGAWPFASSKNVHFVPRPPNVGATISQPDCVKSGSRNLTSRHARRVTRFVHSAAMIMASRNTQR